MAWKKKDKIHNLVKDLMSFDRKNLPIWALGRETLELDVHETAGMLASRIEYSHLPISRTEPHERSVLIIDRDDTRNAYEIYHQSGEQLEREGSLEPCLALLDKNNYVRGEVPLHTYLSHVGVDRLVELIDAGQLSFTYSGLPEATYRRLEDGMDKGREAYAGTINGEAEYNINKDMSLTITNFLRSDNVHVIEGSLSAEIEAALAEDVEEKTDRESTKQTIPDREDTYYTGDYYGWNDPEYESDDDMEII